jgi:hypothetical protein
MIYVGQFNENQLRNGEDKMLVSKKMSETGLKYTKTSFVKKGRNIIGLKVWLLTNDEYYNSKNV